MNGFTPSVISINISPGGIPKRPIPSVRITYAGLDGDGHNHAKHNTPIQAVCLQDIEKVEELRNKGYQLFPGTGGENLTVKNLYVNDFPIGTILAFSGGVVLEISKIRNPCYVMDAIHPKLKEDALGQHGMYAEVICEGVLRVGETIKII